MNGSDDLALALECADLADEISLSRFLSQDLVVETKPDRTPVTDADKAVEEAIRAHIAQAHPGDAIVGEEYGDNRPDSIERYWVIDPIDGTANFLRGVPTWATLIALVEKRDGRDEVVVGVVSAPALFRRWYAARGRGAYVIDGVTAPRRIHVSGISDLSDASLAYSDFKGWGERLAGWQRALEQSWRTRGYGDFWSHMLVAEGAVDAAAEPSLKLWDMAALDIIVREAGGRFTDLAGENGPFGLSALSSNGALHHDIISIINFSSINGENREK